MKIYLTATMIIFLLLAGNVRSLAGDGLFPKGWRIPTRLETKDEWREKDVNRYLYVEADFNGDGMVDKAYLLIRDDNSELGLFAFVSQKNRSYKTFLLDRKKDTNYLRTLGISKVYPGKYKTACGKGIIECAQGEAEEIVLEHYALNYFKFDSAEMYFYWDKTTAAFKAVGIND